MTARVALAGLGFVLGAAVLWPLARRRDRPGPRHGAGHAGDAQPVATAAPWPSAAELADRRREAERRRLFRDDAAPGDPAHRQLQGRQSRPRSAEHEDLSRHHRIRGGRRHGPFDAAADPHPRALPAPADGLRLRAAAARVPEGTDQRDLVRRAGRAQARHPLPRQRHVRAVRPARVRRVPACSTC